MQKESNAKKFGAYIDRTMKIIRHNYLQKFKELGVDLTTEQWVIMDILYGQAGLSQQDLATTSFKNAPTVSRIIDLLCKKKITERKPFANDRRKHKIFLTETGIALYQKLQPSVVELRKQGWQNLEEKDYTEFVRIIGQIYANYEEQ